MPEVIDRLLKVYVRERIEDERFVDTVKPHRRRAVQSDHVYATQIKVGLLVGEDAHMREIIKDKQVVQDDWAVLRLAGRRNAGLPMSAFR